MKWGRRQLHIFASVAGLIILLFAALFWSGEKQQGILLQRHAGFDLSGAFQGAFLQESVQYRVYDPIDSLNRGAKAVEILSSEYGFLGEGYYLYPIYKLTPIIAVNRDVTDAPIRTWSDLREFNGVIGVHRDSEYMLMGINQGLDQSLGTEDGGIALFKELRETDRLFFFPKDIESLKLEDYPPVCIMYDAFVHALNRRGANYEIIVPSEGTVLFPYALLSKEPLDQKSITALATFFEYEFYPLDYELHSNLTEIKSSIYSEFIRLESLLVGNVLKQFRPFRTNIFENAATYVLLLVFLSLLNGYSYFRITDPELRKHFCHIFLILSFWIIIRLIRLLEVNGDIISRYSWYLFYVALLYVPMLMVWIALNVGQKMEELKYKRIKKWMMLTATLLLLMVLSNDLHQLVFRFHDGSFSQYDFHYGMIAIILYYGLCTLYAAGLLFYKAWKMPNRKQLLFPGLLILGIILYIVLFNLFWNNKIALELTKMVVIMITATLFISMYVGLIPQNRMHFKIFQHSKLSMEIRDVNNHIVYFSEKGNLFNTYRIKSQPIQGGSVLWYEDLSHLDALFREEEGLNDQLQENIQVLNKRYEVEKSLEELHAKEKLVDNINTLIREDLIDLENEISDLRALDEIDRKSKLAYLSLNLAGLKHSLNLLVLSLMENQISIEEMVLTLTSLCKAAKMLNVHTTFQRNGSGGLDYHTADEMLRWLTRSIIQMQMATKELHCILSVYEGRVKMALITDREGLDRNPFAAEEEIDNVKIQESITLRENEYVYRGEYAGKLVIK